MPGSTKNNNKIYLQFSKKQIYNRRTIPKLDKNGKPYTLVNVGLPITSKYFGCYITVNINKIKESPLNNKMASTDLFEDAVLSIYYYIKETEGEKRKTLLEKYKKDGFEEHKTLKNVLIKQISTSELKEEFDSWRTSKQEENELEERDICDEY